MGELEAGLAEIEWTRKKVERWTPNVPRGTPGSRHIKTVFYVGPPAGLGEPEPGQPGGPSEPDRRRSEFEEFKRP